MKMFAVLFLLCSLAFAQECKSLEGYASWYGGKFHKRRTASGEVFDKFKYTAASKKFPIGTYLLVRNLENGKEVVVYVNDRGPFKKGRIIDLSKSAAQKIDMIKKGVARVEVIPLYCVAREETTGEDMHEDIIRDLLNTH
ncbi:MAG: septal ring lytic transglycosylase RlpA family protein [Aquificota bacterium]|nr:MAG: septal ring lytic transglycosylase RlpA family protein [Aquificota bacterium]